MVIALLAQNGSDQSPYHGDRPRLNILVVEDQSIFARAVKHAVPGNDFMFVTTVADAIEAYDNIMPDITFLDIALPDGSGHEVLEHIRIRDANAYVVMTTSSSTEEDVQRATKYHANGYVLKPFSNAQIKRYVDVYYPVHRQQLVASMQRAEPEPNERELLLPQNDMTRKEVQESTRPTYRIMFADTFKENRRNALRYLQERGHEVAAASDTDIAVTLLEQTTFDILFIDCQLTGTETCKDGYTLAKSIREREQENARDVPIIIIGLGSEYKKSENKKWLFAGMNDYLVKPARTGMLEDMLRKYQDDMCASIVRGA